MVYLDVIILFPKSIFKLYCFVVSRLSLNVDHSSDFLIFCIIVSLYVLEISFKIPIIHILDLLCMFLHLLFPFKS